MNPVTRANLEAALAGEALSALRYRCFADAAAEEGFADIARLFERIASEELTRHAAELVAVLELRGDTRQNLIRAIERETSKHQRRYAEYAAEATRVGDQDVASLFEKLGGDEHQHATWLRESLDLLAPCDAPSVLAPCDAPSVLAPCDAPGDRSAAAPRDPAEALHH